MVIRCERCSTMYELDEKLLAPTGSDVQCTKCQHVFTALPPRSAGRTLVGVPAEAASPEPSRPAAAPAPSRSAARASGPFAGAPSARGEGAAPRGVRPGAPPVYRPPAAASGAGSAPVGRAPVLRRDTVGTFEARLRWAARWRWLAPLLGVALVAVVVAAWLLLHRHADVGADQAHVEALALVALDDAASLDAASARLAAVVERAPKLRGAAADHALAQVLRAAAVADEVESLAAKLAASADERERLRREQPVGWEAAERAAAAEATTLEPEVRGREEKVRALAGAARDELARVQGELGDTVEVVRGQAALHALAGERDRVRRIVRGRERGPRDAWLDLADGWSDARDPDRAARERALGKLRALASTRPDLLRGRYLLARAQASLGRKAEALATLDGILAANGRHEGSRRLRDELTAPPPPPVSVPGPVQPPAPTPPGKGPPLTRKAVPQPGAGASAGPGASAPSPGGAAAAPASGGAPSAPAPAPAPAEPRPSAAEPPASAPAAAPSSDVPQPPPAAPPRPARRRLEPVAPGPTDG